MNETDYVRPESIPRVAIGAEELQGDVNAMVPHQVVVVVSQDDELVRRDRKGCRSEEICFRTGGAVGDEITDVRRKGWPVEVMSLHHALNVRSRKVAKRVAVIAADS